MSTDSKPESQAEKEDDFEPGTAFFIGTKADICMLIIPGLSEPPVRTLRATIPENGSHIFR